MSKKQLTPTERRSRARALRRDSGLSYAKIGALLGVSRQRVEQYVNGAPSVTKGRPTKPCPVSPDELARLLKANTREAVIDRLGCSEYLLDKWEAELVSTTV